MKKLSTTQILNEYQPVSGLESNIDKIENDFYFRLNDELQNIGVKHANMTMFFNLLSEIDSVTDDESIRILGIANGMVSSGAHGEYDYLYDAISIEFSRRYQDFWDRINGVGDYSESEE